VKPYGTDVVNLRAQVRGYLGALKRFRTAAGGRDAIVAYLPLFEALGWVASIDFRIGVLWTPEGRALGEDWPSRASGAEAVPGLRWARNTVHHDWANALRLDTEGRRYPKRYPVRYFEWVWRDVNDLPPNARTRGKDVYGALLAGKPTEFTLQVLGEVFDFILDLIEPPIMSTEMMASRSARDAS
jgi:hypothetical protein